MIGSRRSQEAQSGAIAIQSERDVVINNTTNNITGGISANDMMAIFECIKAEQRTFAAEARTIIEQRISELGLRLIERIASEAPEASRSFSDPDFHAAMFDAQKSYARTASEPLHETLIDLLFRRATQADRSRRSIALNIAISKAEFLTETDLATLAFIFILNHSVRRGPVTLDLIAKSLQDEIEPLIESVDISTEGIDYLNSLGLLAIPRVGYYVKIKDLSLRLAALYDGTISKGVTASEAESLSDIGSEILETGLFVESEFEPGSYTLAIDKPGALQVSAKYDWAESAIHRYFTIIESRTPSEGEIIKALSAHYQGFERLNNLYTVNNIAGVLLSPSGIAVAHSFATSRLNFKSDLKVWLAK